MTIDSNSFLETVKENIDNKKLSDKDFRDFIKKSMSNVNIKHLPKEQLGILECAVTNEQVVTVCGSEYEQDRIWNMYTGLGRQKRGMKKCKVILIKED